MSDNIPRIFYCHVPKCAGNAVSRVIRKQLFLQHIASTFSIELQPSQRASMFHKLQIMELREILLTYNLSVPENYFGSGHVYCKPRLVESFMDEWAFITILRNPVDRWISEYVFNTYKDSDWSRNTLALKDYICSEEGKVSAVSYIRYFSSMPTNYEGDIGEFVDEAVENLRRFKLVGRVDELEDWCRSFESVFGKEISVPKENTTPNADAVKSIRSNDNVMQQIKELCKPDIEIFDKVFKN